MIRFVAILAFTCLTAVHAQPLVYHCDFENRNAAAKQTTDTATSENGDYAYTLVAGKPLVWLLRSRPVIEWWGATNMSASANGIVAQAFQDWEEASGVNFEKQGDSDSAVWPNQDGASQMLIADPSNLGGAQALTQRFLSGASSSVIETDIGFDPNLMAGSNDAFKVSIARHEIGHLLGLQHVEKSTSLMFATILTGSAKTIDQGSLDGITFLYGEPEGLRNLTVAYLDTLGSGIRTMFPENAALELEYGPNRQTIYAHTDNGTFSSTDGEVWIQSDVVFVEGASGIPFEGGVPVTNYRPAPDEPTTLYGTTNFIVYRSTNGGSTWTLLGATPLVNSISAFLIQNATTVYIATSLGIYKTVDSGENWVQLNTGLPQDLVVRALAQDPEQSATMYAGGVGGVYKTSNGGINWSRIGVGLGATEVTDITVDAQGMVYAVSDIGAFRLSSDESTWETVNTELGTYQVHDILVDPSDTRNILIATRDGIYRSADRGGSFTLVYPSKAPSIVVPQEFLILGDFEVGQTATQTIEIQNTGQGPLVITRLETDVDGLTVPETPITIQPGASGTLRFMISRDTAGTVAGSVTIFTNDPEQPDAFLGIFGTGIIILADSRADFDGNGAVDFTDFLGFAGAFGTTDATYDIDASGTVDFSDFLIFASSFGRPLS